MGKPVESYKLLDGEIQSWNGFSRALRGDDKEAFERLMEACRNYAAGGDAARSVLFESMEMSILLSHQKKLNELEKDLDAFKLRVGQP